MVLEQIRGKAIVTGASGFIGSWVRDRLLDAGVDVISIRRKGSPETKRGRSVVADYADAASLDALIESEDPEYVFHVAGATAGVTYEDFDLGNRMPTQHLAEATRRHAKKLRRFVYVSSLTSYGPSTLARPLVESDPRRPIEHYGKSKLAAEEALEAMGDAFPWTIVRPAGVYGPRNTEFFKLFELIHKGWNVFYGNRERAFSIIYGDDCVDAIFAAAVAPKAVGRGYFLADGAPVTWASFQTAMVERAGRPVRTIDLPGALLVPAAWGGELMAKLSGKPSLFNQQKALMGRQEAWTCAIDAARADLGFVPKIDAAEGIVRSFAWYREQGWLR